jgi:CheY-like chemotaxis protein
MASNIPILVVDDNEDDVFFLCRAFEKAGLNHPIIHVSDGEEAVDYLSGENGFADRSQYPLPKLMLLDVKMPRRDGFDVLQWLLTRKDLEKLPVVMLSSSLRPEDVEKAKALGAIEYLCKPIESEGFDQVVQTIASRWLTALGTNYYVAVP